MVELLVMRSDEFKLSAKYANNGRIRQYNILKYIKVLYIVNCMA